MDIACNRCGAQNREGARFCHVCGAGLPAAAAPALQHKPTELALSLPDPSAFLLLADGSMTPLSTSTTIGRDDAQCSLAFPNDSRLSRCHCRISEQAGCWYIEDLGSTNGTYVNGARIYASTLLHTGDQVLAGSLACTFKAPGGAGAAIVPAQGQAANLSPAAGAPLAGQMMPAGMQGPLVPFGAPAGPQPPPGGWRRWTSPPYVEGYVKVVSPRYMMKKDDLVKRGMMAAALAIFVTPALAFLPLMQGNEIAAQDLRVEDYQSGRMVDIKVIGDMMGNINMGDPVAVWGIDKGGLIIMQAAYNYATNSNIGIKK